MPDTRQFVADRQQLALRRQQLALLERHARITVVLSARRISSLKVESERSRYQGESGIFL